MSQSRRATICLFASGDAPESFQRCLERVLSHTPLEQIELRLGLSQAEHSLYYALGLLCPDGVWPAHQALAGAVERFQWMAVDTGRADGASTAFPVRAWQTSAALSRERMARLVYHDMRLAGEHAVSLDQEVFVEAGWWEALQPLFDQGVDYVGQPQWHEYAPEQLALIQAQPWYMGVPFDRRERRAGVSFMAGGLAAVRSERLREAREALAGRDSGGEVHLGEMARQLGWTQAAVSATQS